MTDDAERNGDAFREMGDADANGDTTDADHEWPDTDTDADDTPERPTKEESTLGRLGAKLIATVPKPLLGVRGTLYKRLAVKSIENYHKTAGGDAIGINARAGQEIALEPVAYKSPEECAEGEQPGWHVKGRDKSWNPGSEGNTVNYLGRTPTVLLDDDAHVEAGWLAPRIGEAVEIGNHRPVFTDPNVNAVIDAAAPGANGARADGGANMEFELESPGVFSGDNLINLDSGPNHDGMRISAAKAREWQAENAPSEQMQLQDDRAYMRGLIEAMDDSDTAKAFIYAALFALAVIALVVLGPKLMGGGGGGGMNPLMINAVGAFAPV